LRPGIIRRKDRILSSMANFFSTNCDDVTEIDDVTEWDDKTFSVDDTPSDIKAWAEARLFKKRIAYQKYYILKVINLQDRLDRWFPTGVPWGGVRGAIKCLIYCTFSVLPLRVTQIVIFLPGKGAENFFSPKECRYPKKFEKHWTRWKNIIRYDWICKMSLVCLCHSLYGLKNNLSQS